jgi:hypothetical protein
MHCGPGCEIGAVLFEGNTFYFIIMGKVTENLLKRAEKVQRIVDEHYEPGNQSKCKLQVYRKHVVPVYPMSERTFWRYMEVSKKMTGREAMSSRRHVPYEL